jgi:hypothetical protein
MVLLLLYRRYYYYMIRVLVLVVYYYTNGEDGFCRSCSGPPWYRWSCGYEQRQKSDWVQSVGVDGTRGRLPVTVCGGGEWKEKKEEVEKSVCWRGDAMLQPFFFFGRGQYGPVHAQRRSYLNGNHQADD